MASVTTDTNLSAVSYTAGETIAVSNNAILTIDSTPATIPGTISVSDVRGTIYMTNSSTTTPIVLTLNGFANDIAVSGNGLFKTRGRWINIGTGDGTASQTLDFDTCVGGVAIDRPMCVLVERERLGDDTSNFTLTNIGTDANSGKDIWRITRNSGTDWAIADSRTKAGNWKMHCVGHITMAGWANSVNNDIFNVHDYDTAGTWIEFEAPHYATPIAEASVTSVTIKSARIFYHIGIAADTADVAITNYYPNWEAGRVYAYDSSTKVATFGDGSTGGVVIPNGSKVYYPNIHVTSQTSNATITVRSMINCNVSGSVDIDMLAVSERIVTNNMTNMALCKIRNMFIGANNSRILSASNLSEFIVNGLYAGLDSTFGSRSSGSSGTGVSSVIAATISLKNIGVCQRNDASATSPIDLQNTNGIEGFNFEILAFRNAVATCSLNIAVCTDVSIRNLSYVGAYVLVTDSENIYLENIRISSSTSTTDENVTMMTLTSSLNTIVNGYYSIPNLGRSLSYVINAPISNTDVVIHHGEIDIPSTNGARPLTLLGTRQACAFLDITDITSCPTITPSSTSTTKRIRLANVTTNTQKNMTYCSGFSVDGVSSSGFNSTTNNSAAVDDPNFYLMYTSSAKTAAVLQVGLFAPESELEYIDVTSGTLGGDVYFNNKGYLNFEADGNQIVQTSKRIGGITSFQNVAPTISGTDTGTLTFEYAISEDNLAWGSYATLNATNLSGETLPNFQDGFFMRIRITASGADLTRYVSRITMDVNTDASYAPVIDWRDAVFTGLIQDSVVGVFDGATLIGTAVADASGYATIPIPCLFDNVEVTYDYKARKAGYREVIGQLAMKHKDVATVISQVLDRTVGAGSVNVTIDGALEEITSAGSGLNILDVYDSVQLWSELEENIEYDIPITKVTVVEYAVTSSWEHIVTGDVSNLTLELTGTTTVDSGGFFEDITGAKWEASGSVYYASNINSVIKVGASPIANVEVGFFDASNNNRTYSTGLALVNSLTSNGSGVVTGYAVYRIDASVFNAIDLRAREYNYQPLVMPLTIAGDAFSSDVFMAVNSFVTGVKATVAAYTGIAVNYGTQDVTITVDQTHTTVYDYVQYSFALAANLDEEIVPVSTADGTNHLYANNWDLNVVGASVELDEEGVEIDVQGTGVISITSGAFFEDASNVIWEAGGDIYYASHLWGTVLDGTTSLPIQNAVVGWADVLSETELVYDLALAVGGLLSDVNGEVEGYLVWKINSTTFVDTKFIIGEYNYNFIEVPTSLNGSPVGSAALRNTSRITIDNQVVLSKAAALAITGVTHAHTASPEENDLGDNTLPDAYDNLKARQARPDDIATGNPGYISYAAHGLLLEKNGTTFTGVDTMLYLNVGDSGKFVDGTIVFDTPGAIARSYENVDFDFSVAGTYDFRTSEIEGTSDLTNSSAGNVTVKLHPDHLYTNTGPNITVETSISVSITAPNILDGSRVQIYNVTQAAEIDNSIVSGGSGYSYVATMGPGEEAEDGDSIRIRVTYVSGSTIAKEEIEGAAIIGEAGIIYVNSQSDDEIYLAWALSGAAMTEFAADYPNIQVDINDPDNITQKKRLGAWLKYIVTTADGIRNFFGAESTSSVADIRINVSIVDLKLDNVSGSEVYFNDLDIRLYRSDLTQIIASGSDSIFLDYSGVPFVVDNASDALTLPEFLALK